jgi:hypothetical protein
MRLTIEPESCKQSALRNNGSMQPKQTLNRLFDNGFVRARLHDTLYSRTQPSNAGAADRQAADRQS